MADKRSLYHVIVSLATAAMVFPSLLYYFEYTNSMCTWITAGILVIEATGSELWDITLKPYLSSRKIFYSRYWPAKWDWMDWFFTVVPGWILIVILNFIL